MMDPDAETGSSCCTLIGSWTLTWRSTGTELRALFLREQGRMEKYRVEPR